jgi:hypothetical protein
VPAWKWLITTESYSFFALVHGVWGIGSDRMLCCTGWIECAVFLAGVVRHIVGIVVRTASVVVHLATLEKILGLVVSIEGYAT